MTDQQYFIITSYGRTGTQWIAKVLSGHPDIAVTHGPEIQLNPDPAETREERITRHSSPDNPINKLHIDDVMKELGKQTAKRYVGNVHGQLIHPILKAPYRTRQKYRCAQIVRHPVHRIDSFANHHRDTAKTVPIRLEMLRSDVRTVLEKAAKLKELTLEADFESDVEAMARLFSLYVVWFTDRSQLEFRADNFTFERLISDRDYLLSLVSHISDEGITIGAEFEQHITDTSAQDTTGKTDRTVTECLEAWPDWQIKVFDLLYPKQTYQRIYQEFGYGYPLSGHEGL